MNTKRLRIACNGKKDMPLSDTISQQTPRRECEACKGSGLDKKHTYPDGSCAACETCDGYGFIEPKVSVVNDWEEHNPQDKRVEFSAKWRQHKRANNTTNTTL